MIMMVVTSVRWWWWWKTSGLYTNILQKRQSQCRARVRAQVDVVSELAPAKIGNRGKWMMKNREMPLTDWVMRAVCYANQQQTKSLATHTHTCDDRMEEEKPRRNTDDNDEMLIGLFQMRPPAQTSTCTHLLKAIVVVVVVEMDR